MTLVTCTARLDILTEEAPERLVIYGYITNTSRQHEIRITRSNGYFASTAPEGISNAQVALSVGDKTIHLKESLKEQGLYRTPVEMVGKAGETYSLRVSLDFDGDGEEEIFEASSYMPYPPQIDSIGLRESAVMEDVIEILVYGKVPENEENHFSFHAALNNTILNDSLGGFFIISDEYIIKNEFAGLSCFFLDQEDEESKLVSGDEVTLFVDILTPEYATFLDNAKSESGGSVPLFGGPPANVGTNIRSIQNPNNIPVSGFFSAFSGDRASRYYDIP